MKSSFSSCPQHESFEELAALAAVGELSPLEVQRLRHHLLECLACREVCEAFVDVASNDLGVAAAARQSTEHIGLGDANETEAQEHLGRLRSRLRADASAQRPSGGLLAGYVENNRHARLRASRRVGYAVAATLLLTVAVGSGIAFRRTAKDAAAERARSRELQSVVDSLKQQEKNDRASSENTMLRSLHESQKARDTLEKSLTAFEAKNQELLGREKASEQKLEGAIAAAEELRQQLAANAGDRERLARLQQESDAKLHEALVELYQARQVVQTAAKDQSHEDVTLEAFEQPPSEAGAARTSPTEVEARSLFGARDLHIVDVYDVTGDGKTKRTYGRVYYVEKKLLVFYAFDLQNRQDHKRGVFPSLGLSRGEPRQTAELGPLHYRRQHDEPVGSHRESTRRTFAHRCGVRHGRARPRQHHSTRQEGPLRKPCRSTEPSRIGAVSRGLVASGVSDPSISRSEISGMRLRDLGNGSF